MDREYRIKALQSKIGEIGLSGAVLNYSRNILYYTGTAQPSLLLVKPDDYRLFVRSGFEFALKDTFIGKERVIEERRPEKIIRGILPGSGARLGVELDIWTVEQFEKFRKSFPGFDFLNISSLILEQRKKKDPQEIEAIRKACDTIHKGHEAALACMREGITELELAAAVENAQRLAGHEGIFFIRQPDFFMSRGPISSGANLFKISGVVYTITGIGLSPAVPAGPSRKKITKGDPVIIDIPTLVGGYHADQTRTYFLGKAGAKIRCMYRDLKTVADHLIELMRPGMKCNEIFRAAAGKARELGRQDHFQNFGGGKISRIIGHGIGLELNEPPILSEYDSSEIGEGYVLALDIHMMDENAGVVKLEDMILVREGGNQILTRTPRDLFESGTIGSRSEKKIGRRRI
ncbi:MAG: M24 family metallopeptidase [Syntrophales bacterium]